MMIVVMTTADLPLEEPRRLTRSREDRIVAGVCSGAARYFDIDPVIFRVVLAVLAVFGGAGIVLYAFGWLLIPEDGSPSTRLERWLEGKHGDRRRDILIVVLALIALSFIFDSNPFAHRITGAGLVIVVVLTVLALLGRRNSGQQTSASYAHPFGPRPAPAGPAPDWGPVGSTATWTYTPTPKRPRSWLGWLTLGSTLLVAGIFCVVGFTGLAHPQPADVLAACVAVVGIGLLVGTIAGRAWSMIPLGLLLVALLGAADALPRNLTWTAGNRTWAPISADIRTPYVLGAGDATLDLSALGHGVSSTIVSRIGAGRLVVIVPRGAALVIHAHASAGRIEVFDHEDDGTSVDVRRDIAAAKPATAGTLTLDLQVGYGDLEVRDAAA
jgi:phage shock protein PspC (stress-responsive transcriptional regulator)